MKSAARYRQWRIDELNTDITKLTAKGIHFHHKRSAHTQPAQTPQSPIRIIFMLCCFIVMLYYVVRLFL